MQLIVENLAVHKNGNYLIRDVSFQVAKGSVLAISGPSGAGKSTTLHRICGLIDHSFETSGRVILDGHDVTNNTPESLSRLGLAIVLQGLALFNNRSVIGNVAYPLRRRGYSRTESSTLARETLARFQMDTLASRFPTELSGGQQQRVALARAMSYNPKLLLLDEPFKGLEYELRDEFLALVRSLASEGISVVLVTHEKREISLAADIVVAMKDGIVSSIERRDGSGRLPFATTSERISIPAKNGERVIRIPQDQVTIYYSDGDVPEDQESFSAEVVEVRPIARTAFAVMISYTGRELKSWIEMDHVTANRLTKGSQITLALNPSDGKVVEDYEAKR